MRRRDHTHVNARRLTGSNGNDLSFLKRPEQLYLKTQRKLTDFVKE